MARVANGTSLDAVDNSRYCVEKPEGVFAIILCQRAGNMLVSFQVH